MTHKNGHFTDGGRPSGREGLRRSGEKAVLHLRGSGTDLSEGSDSDSETEASGGIGLDPFDADGDGDGLSEGDLTEEEMWSGSVEAALAASHEWGGTPSPSSSMDDDSSLASDILDDSESSTEDSASESSTQEDEEAARPVPISTVLWNIENLGGGFHHPVKRADVVIDSIAPILAQTDADVIAILELKQNPGTTPAPKKPLQPSHRFGRSEEGIWGKGKEQTKADTVAFFNEVVDGLVWGQNPDFEPPSDFDALEGAALAKELAALAALAAAQKGNVDALKKDKYVDWKQKFVKKHSTKAGQAALKKEGVVDPAKEGEARDAATKKARDELQAAIDKAFVSFVEAVTKHAIKSPADMQSLKTALQSTDYEREMKKYKATYAAWEAEQKELQEFKEAGHPGVREFYRIRDRLNALVAGSGKTYASWPSGPVEDLKSGEIYTHAESYGVLWDTAKLGHDPTKAKAQFASGRHPDLKYSQREPLCVPLTLNDGGAEIVVIPYHAPAPSSTHRDHRKTDFEATQRLCEHERAAGSMAVILTDLNVDTASHGKGEKKVEEMTDSIATSTLWKRMTGNSELPTHLEYGNVKTTFAQSKMSPFPFVHAMIDPNASARFMRDVEAKNQRLAKQAKGDEEAIARISARQDALKQVFANLQDLYKGTGFKSAPHQATTPLDIIERIESMVVDTRGGHGSAGYDKTLIVSDGSGAQRLTHRAGIILPFAMALSFKEEAALWSREYRDGLPKIAHLLDQTGPDSRNLAEDLRAWFAESSKVDESLLARPAEDLVLGDDHAARLLAIIQVARALSDHMPLYAELLVHGVKVPPQKNKELFDLCDRLANEKDAAARTEITDELLQRMESDDLDAGDRARLAAKITAALDKNPAPVEANDAVDFTKKLPDLEKDGKGAVKLQKMPKNEPDDGKTVLSNAGQGDCLFLSLSQIHTGGTAAAQQMRLEIVAHLRKMLSNEPMDGGFNGRTRQEVRDTLKQLFDYHKDTWPNAAPYKTPAGGDPWQHYLATMAKPGAWGDLVTLAAASHLYGTAIDVRFEQGARSYRVGLDFSSAPHKPTMELRNDGNRHFEAIVPPGHPALQKGGPAKLSPAKATTTSSATSTTTSSARPQPTGPVFKWPPGEDNYWSRADAQKSPRALFVFGENIDDSVRNLARFGKTKPKEQSETQAVIRPEPNAFGVCTCTTSGGPMVDKNGAIDPNNKAEIDEDIKAIKAALASGKFDTLVVPWNTETPTAAAPGSHTLGTGVAKKVTKAGLNRDTLAYITQQIKDLMSFAETTLPAASPAVSSSSSSSTAPAGKGGLPADDNDLIDWSNNPPSPSSSQASSLGLDDSDILSLDDSTSHLPSEGDMDVDDGARGVKRKPTEAIDAAKLGKRQSSTRKRSLDPDEDTASQDAPKQVKTEKE